MELQTKEFENNAGTDNHIGVSDDIGKEMLASQKEEYEKELEAYQGALEQIDKDVANYTDQWLLDKEEMQLQYDNFGLLDDKFSHKVHTIPRFWEIQKEKFMYKIRQETHQAEQWLNQKAIEKEKAIERIDIIKKNLERVSNELEE